MEFNARHLFDSLPPADPPMDAIPAEVREVAEDFNDRREVDPKRFRSSLLWTTAILHELQAGRAQPISPARWMQPEELTRWAHGPELLSSWWCPFNGTLSVGALDGKFERFPLPPGVPGGFGIIVTANEGGRGSFIGGVVTLPALGVTVPLVRRFMSEDMHACPSQHLSNSRCASDARESRTGTRGLVTAKHNVTGHSIGATLALSGGGTGTLRDACPSVVDGAFVEYKSVPVPAMGPRIVMQYPSAGLPVRVHAAHGVFRATVTNVTQTHGVIDDALHPIKVYLDRFGQAGDSGGLVETAAGEAIGIYSGAMSGATLNGQTGITLGFAQHIGQAAALMNLQLLE